MKKRLNIKYLGGLVGVAVLFCTSVHFLHAFQVKRNAGSLYTQALQMEEEGDLNQAADYLSRYLGLVPGDTEARARYGLLLSQEKMLTWPKARDRAFLVLQDVLRREPQRQDVRRRSARLALDLQRFNDALEDLERLRKPVPENGEIEQLLARCHEGKRNYKEARKCLENAIKLAPKEIENYEHLAYLLRSHTDEVMLGRQETRSQVLKLADQKIDAMVAANSQSYKAHLARLRYRKAFASGNSAAQTLAAKEQDVTRARQLAPDDLEVLLAAADVAQERHDPQGARAYLHQARQRHPGDWRVYQLLAKLEVQEDRPDDAVACLRTGLKELPKQFELLWSLADLLIERGRKQEAIDVIARLRKEGVPPAELDYLNARLLVNEAKWLEAARVLEGAYPALLGLTNAEQDRFVSSLVQQTGLLLGRCYDQLGDSARAYAAYSRVVTRDPRSVAGRLGSAQTQWALGRLTDSLDEYRKLMRLSDAPPAGWIDFARLLIQRNQQVEEPDWSEVDHALTEAERRKLPATEISVLRAEVLVTQAQRQDDQSEKQKLFDQARGVLEKGFEEPNSRPIEIWTALAALEDLQGRPENALRLLDHAEAQRGDSTELRLARARYWARHPGPLASPSLAKLTQDLGKFKTDEQQRLLRGVAGAYLATGARTEAEGLWQRVAEQQPHNLECRLVLLDLALQAGQESAVQRLVQELRQIEGEEGLSWRYAEVCRLIWRAKEKGDKGGLAAARTLVSGMAQRRPNWSRVSLCEGQIADLLGDREAALAGYKRALQLGERGTLVLRRTLELLYERRRYVEARELLQKIPKQQLLSSDFRRVAAEVSLRVQDGLQAVAVAQSAVANDSKDYRDHLWLGHVLWAAGKTQEAGPAFCRARDLADTVPDTWVALIQYLAASGQKQKAQEEIADAERKLPKDQAALALAQCYEALGRKERAQELYRAALAARPDDVAVLQGIASFYVRAGQLQEAQPYLRRINDEFPNKAPEAAAWARRTLALLLTLAGDYQQAREALLSFEKAERAKGPGGDAALDQRTRAWLLAMQKNQQERRQAIRLLEELTERESATAEDQFLLALLYEGTGAWPKARIWWQKLLERQDASALQLSQCALSLLRHEEVEEAEQVLSRLKKLEPAAWPTQEIQARILTATGNGDGAVALLKQQAAGKDAKVATIAALLEELGHAAAAEELYRKQLESSKQPEGVLALVSFLGRQKRFREALDLCEEAWQTCPPVAVAQASVRILAEAPGDPAQVERFERRLQSALQKSPDSLPLWSSLAFLRHIQGRYDEAESLCRQILEKDSHNVTALNNLAWLLTFKGGQGPQQALELVQRAYQVIGPHPRLLDTRAVIYLALGKVDLAVKDLEDVLAENPEASTYFHLAQARWMMNNRKAAGEALRQAKNRGLKDSSRSLHPLERAPYQQLCRELGQP